VARSGTGRDLSGYRNAPGSAPRAFQARPAGLEPATFGFVDRCDPVQESPSAGAVSCSDSSALATSGTLQRGGCSEGERATERATLDPDAAALLALWPHLTPPARAGLLAMAEAAARLGGQP